MVVLGLATSHHYSKIAGTFAQQLGWAFVGPFHPSAHGPPAKLRSFTSLQMVHTHAHTQILYSYILPLSLSHTHARTHTYINIYVHTHTHTCIYYIGRPLPGLLHDSFVLVKWDFSLNPMQGWKSQSVSQPRCWI